MNKELIQARFSKTLSSYNENAKIQKKMAETLLTLLSRNNYKNILEIGCGTGFLTELVNKKIKFESYMAVDIVEECRDYIININSDIEFVNADIEYYLQNLDKYDLIISNAAIQWVSNFEKTVNRLRDNLNSNGELVFSTFGKENFKEIFQITGATLDYYSANELELLFPDGVVYSEIHVMEFASPKDVLKHLQLTGVNAIRNKSWTKGDLSKFEKAYKSICSFSPLLTYNPVYIKLAACSK